MNAQKLSHTKITPYRKHHQHFEHIKDLRIYHTQTRDKEQSPGP